jgi:alpha-L-fucosidase
MPTFRWAPALVTLSLGAGGLLAVGAGAAPLAAQQPATPRYIPDPDPLVREKLDQWQDLKLGLLMHWGTYSEWGIVESWSLCSEDEPWCRRKMDNYDDYKKAYEALQTTFNPVQFDPERWARAARDAGMRYVVFTTKHHDGFNMFDTHQSDYKITSPRTPFSTNPDADVTRAIFDAFRADSFMIGAYFSKADWHSPDYWWPYFATPDRYPNYDVRKYPERWARFVAFTHAQIHELMTRYGRIDILWLDAGWVRTLTDSEIHAAITSPDYRFEHIQSLDIDMPGLVADARANQPGLIVVDRDVPGPYQDYLTPEARVPDHMLPYPWEVPMPMATSWSYVPHDHYKSVRTLIQMLVDVVAKGGNLLLNIGPGPDGSWDPVAYDRLAGLGAWMKVNSEAIYATRPVAPYVAGNLRFTRSNNGAVYVIDLPTDSTTSLPRHLAVPDITPAVGATVTLLGTRATLPWQLTPTGFSITIPDAQRPPNPDAWVFRVSSALGSAQPQRTTPTPTPTAGGIP